MKELSLDLIFHNNFWQDIKSFCKQNSKLRIHSRPDRNQSKLSVCTTLIAWGITWVKEVYWPLETNVSLWGLSVTPKDPLPYHCYAASTHSKVSCSSCRVSDLQQCNWKNHSKQKVYFEKLRNQTLRLIPLEVLWCSNHQRHRNYCLCREMVFCY